MIQALLEKYALRILAGLLSVAVVIGGYYYIKHQGALDERDEWMERDLETRRKSEDLLRLKQHEADLRDKQNQERANNAIQIYANHYDVLRAAANAIPERVFITTKANCGGDTMPGASESGPKTQNGTERTGKAELPDANIRGLNKTILMIEDMQLKCERLLNTVP